MGKLENTMYGALDAHQTRAHTVKVQTMGIGFKICELHTSVHWREEDMITAVAHVDDFLCIGEGEWGHLMWLYTRLKDKYDCKKSLPEPRTRHM